MKSRRLILTCILGLLLVTSCGVEFSPNAAWKEIPVIYCVLDQDDDVTWARVERCFLGDDDIHAYGQIADSINYPEGSIIVSLHGFDANGNEVDSIPFQYTLERRDSGDFAGGMQPVYRANTANRLLENRKYALRVRHAANDSLIASSDKVSLIVQERDAVFTKPTVPFGRFGFGTDGKFEMEWPALNGARLYTPVVRFYYEEEGDTTYLDFQTVRTRGTSATYTRDVFLTELKQQLSEDTARKTYIREADLFLTACSEELYAYINSNSIVDNLVDVHQVYSNINGGLGIVASRRTHLKKTIEVDEGIEEGRGLAWFIFNLGINMH